MNFETLYTEIIEEKNKAKLKPLSGYDYYKGIRKATPPSGAAFKDKSKYNRKEKFKKDLHEEVESKSAFKELIDFLKTKGIETSDLFEVQKYITKIVNETLRTDTKNPFK